jgi:hypothetical protein
MPSTSSPQAALDLKEQQELGKFSRRQGNLHQLGLLNAVLDQGQAMKGVARVRKAIDDAAVRAASGQPPSATSQQPDDEMQTIIFGDNIQQAPPPPSKLGTLAKLGIGAALIASGAGVGMGLPVLLDALRPAAVAPQPPTNTNTTTTIERDYSIGEVRIE